MREFRLGTTCGEAFRPGVVADGVRSASTDSVIRPDDIVIVENGQVTIGPPKVTEEVEKKVYKTLSFHRNVANEIEANVPGGNAGSHQSRQDYDFAVKNYKSLYQLSDADIAAILKKGDEQGWK
jgi:hypothetical protein